MKTNPNDITLDELFEICPIRLQKFLIPYLREIPSVDLKNAMEYSALGGGKHLRPLLIYATGNIFNANFDNLDIPASAVEVIHTYSLIHDDLPCMDDSDLRRGKPSNHKVYGEAIAVLAGDALHTLAMQIMASHPATFKADKRVEMIKTLATSCGPFGMAAGQALDITELQGDDIKLDLLLEIYRLKTGALISASIELGRLAAGDDDEINQKALKDFGEKIGLAFQIQDDILDIETSTEALGKPQGLDVKNKKVTYPKLVGLQPAKDKVATLYQQALESIDYLGGRARLLRELANFILVRKH